MEAERSHVAQTSGRPSLVGGTERLRRVFDDYQFVSPPKLHQAFHVCGETGVVHSEDCLGGIGDSRAHPIGAQLITRA